MTTPLRLKPRKKMSNFKFWTESCRKSASGQFINGLNIRIILTDVLILLIPFYLLLYFVSETRDEVDNIRKMDLLHKLLSRERWKSEPVSNFTFIIDCFVLGKSFNLHEPELNHMKKQDSNLCPVYLRASLRVLWDKICEDSDLFSLRNVWNNKGTASWVCQWVDAEQ